MPSADVGGIVIEYETFGDKSDEPMLLIMGLGMQLTGWDVAFCRKLAAEGFLVIRYDNRDVGLSSRQPLSAPPDFFAIYAGDHATVAYTLDDLAHDAVGLLDVLAIESAHIVGASMGGMVAQLVAVHHPDRVRSLASIMATTGARDVGQPHPEAIATLMAPPTGSPEEDAFRVWQTIGSKTYPLSERQIRAAVQTNLERETEPSGAPRQLAAILAAPDRTAALRELSVPTVVIHGSDDPLVDVSGGRATADAVPDATLMIVDGMAHDLPSQVWDTVIPAIVRNARRS